MPVARSTTPSLLLCGYYGEHNLGDDALLQVLLQGLPDYSSLVITAADREAVLALAPTALVINRRSLTATLRAALRTDLLIFGGGSLLQDSTSFRSLIYYLLLICAARIRGGRVLLWGQGLGPLRRSISRNLVRWILPLCSAISWRDHASLALARGWARTVPMWMAPDPVWQMPQRNWIGGGEIVVCWRPSPLLNSGGWRLLLDALDCVSDELGAQVCWLAFHQHQDAVLMDQLHERELISQSLLKRSRSIVPRSLEEVFSQLTTARLVLPMRLHALIIAGLAGSPIAALSYDPKVEAAASMAEVPCISLNALPEPADLAALWRGAADRGVDPDRIEEIRQRSAAHAQLLNDVIQPGTSE